MKKVPAGNITTGFLNLRLDQLKQELNDTARQYRDQILTRLDEVMGELQNIREDNAIGSHQISELGKTTNNHEKRIKKLEQSTPV